MNTQTHDGEILIDLLVRIHSTFCNAKEGEEFVMNYEGAKLLTDDLSQAIKFFAIATSGTN